MAEQSTAALRVAGSIPARNSCNGSGCLCEFFLKNARDTYDKGEILSVEQMIYFKKKIGGYHKAVVKLHSISDRFWQK